MGIGVLDVQWDQWANPLQTYWGGTEEPHIAQGLPKNEGTQSQWALSQVRQVGIPHTRPAHA